MKKKQLKANILEVGLSNYSKYWINERFKSFFLNSNLDLLFKNVVIIFRLTQNSLS